MLAQHVEHGLAWNKEMAVAHPEVLQLVQAQPECTLQKSEARCNCLCFVHICNSVAGLSLTFLG